MITVEEIKSRIQQGLNTQSVEVEGDGHHFSATIISQDFQGKTELLDIEWFFLYLVRI